MTLLAWIAVVVFVTAYVFIATEWVHHVKVAVAGAAVMLILGISNSQHAFFSEESGIDWNVLALLLGMMIIVTVLRRTGGLEYVAIWAAKRAKARPFRVMAILVLLSALASAALPNVTVVLLVAPVTLLVCDRLGTPVAPYLIAEAMASNIGGTATLVGDPPNLIVASRAGFSFNDFLVVLAPIVLVILVVFVLLCRWLFRRSLSYDAGRAAEVLSLRERDAIRSPRLLVLSLGVLLLVIVGFVVGPLVDLEPSVVALVGGLALLAFSRLDATAVARDVEWGTLVFFAGLFIMVGGLVNTGVVSRLSHHMAGATEGNLLPAAMGLMWFSAALSGLIDNIPYVATMSPIIADLSAARGSGDVLWWALLLGADLGGNATAIGASANVVVLGIAERHGQRISFWDFTKYGLVVTVVTVAVCVPYLWLRFF
jgi:Na+/H+ antiporter NhaD/arsenite permease-like protein